MINVGKGKRGQEFKRHPIESFAVDLLAAGIEAHQFACASLLGRTMSGIRGKQYQHPNKTAKRVQRIDRGRILR